MISFLLCAVAVVSRVGFLAEVLSLSATSAQIINKSSSQNKS